MDVLEDLIAVLVAVGVGVAAWNKTGKNKKRGKGSFDFRRLFNRQPEKIQEAEIPSEGASDADVLTERSFARHSGSDKDEYRTAETYETEDTPYEEKTAFHDIDYSTAYDGEHAGNELSELEKGIIFSELLSKPVGLRR